MLSLYSTWWVKPEFINDMQPALDKLVAMVEKYEKDTLMYLVHSPRFDSPPAEPGKKQWVSEPMVRPGTLIFVEKYRNWDAFLFHTTGKAFTTFFNENRDKFVQGHDGKPFTQVVFMEEQASFFRKED